MDKIKGSTEVCICPNCEAEVPAIFLERREIENVIAEDWVCTVCHGSWVDVWKKGTRWSEDE